MDLEEGFYRNQTWRPKQNAFSYFVRRKGYFHPTRLTVGIWNPLISLLSCVYDILLLFAPKCWSTVLFPQKKLFTRPAFWCKLKKTFFCKILLQICYFVACFQLFSKKNCRKWLFWSAPKCWWKYTSHITFEVARRSSVVLGPYSSEVPFPKVLKHFKVTIFVNCCSIFILFFISLKYLEHLHVRYCYGSRGVKEFKLLLIFVS